MEVERSEDAKESVLKGKEREDDEVMLLEGEGEVERTTKWCCWKARMR